MFDYPVKYTLSQSCDKLRSILEERYDVIAVWAEGWNSENPTIHALYETKGQRYHGEHKYNPLYGYDPHKVSIAY